MQDVTKQIRVCAAAAAFALAVLSGAKAYAQAVFGQINGTVTDTTGAAIPNATITVTDVAKGTSVTLQSNGSGEFTAEHLIPDEYSVKVAAQGFKGFQQTGVRVFADTNVKVDAPLTIGGSDQVVEVSADQVPQLKTDRADVATTFSAQEVTELPIPDRNFTNLQLLLPGAQQLGWGHAASENPQGSKQIEVDGQAFAGVNYQLDGTDNQDPILGIIVINPNVDSLSEAKITTQNFDAEFGKAVSSVVTVQTKSGTNSFHGSAFDYRESNANLARDPFSQGPGSFFPGGLRNQFGGSLGGPIKKDKAFFFMDYQGVRQKVGISQSQTVPTNRVFDTCLGTAPTATGVLGCDFSDYTAISNIYDNSATGGGAQFAGNVIPIAQVSPQFLAFLKVLSPYRQNAVGTPVKGLTGIKNNFQAGGNGSLNDDQWDVRGDYTVSERVHAFGRFSRFTDILAGNPVLGPAGGKGLGLNGYSGQSQGANDSAAAGVDVALNPKLVFDVRLGYFRYNIGTHKYNEGVPFMANLGIPGENLGNITTSGAGGFSLQDPGNFGTSGDDGSGSVYGQALGWTHCNCPLTEREDQFQLANNWTKTVGNHAVKFGVDLRYARNLRVPSDTDRTGINRFGTGATGNGQASTGLSFATFALGDVTQFGRYFSTSTNAKEFQKRYFGYVQDTWRAQQNLTLNLGLRYEAYFPETINQSAGGSLLNLNTGYLQVAGVGQVASNMNIGLPTYAFNPRLGINYEARPGTVIRAGYGRSFDIGVFGSIFGHAATQNLPILSSQQLNPPSDGNAQSKQFVFTLASGPPTPQTVTVPSNGLLPNPGAVVNSHARPTTERLPTLDAWNAALQQSLSPTWSMTIAYVANKGTHTLGDASGNETNPNEPGDLLPAQYSINGQALHWDPTVGSTISSTGGTSNSDLLRRYYGAKLPACSDTAYAGSGGKPGVNPLTGLAVAGSCGWNSDIQYYENGLDTHYNSMQVSLAKQMAHGYSLNANYAWQQAISEAPGYSTWNRQVVRGRDSALRQQQIIVYGVLQLPMGRGKRFFGDAHGIINQIVSGYEINPVVNFSSGLPFTLSYGSNLNPTNQHVGDAPFYLNGDARGFHPHTTGTPNGGLSFYPAFTGTGTLSAPGYAPFTIPNVLQFGNVGRDTVFGPHFFNTDLSIQKAFPIRESFSFIVRADGYNAFNHINWGNPNGNIENGGSIGSGPYPNGSSNPRQLQFSGRIQF